jgi:hypothetical protein
LNCLAFLKDLRFIAPIHKCAHDKYPSISDRDDFFEDWEDDEIHGEFSEYWKELQKREGTLEIQTAFLQKLALEENRSKGLLSKSGSGYANKRRKLTRSKRQRFKLELTKEAGNSEKSSKEIVNAVRILQRRTSGRSADERERSGFAEGARTG